MPYDQVILIPGGGPQGTGAREVLDLFSHPESSGVSPGDPRWRGWLSDRVTVAERVEGATVGYGVGSAAEAAIDRLLENARSKFPEVLAPTSTGQGVRRAGWSKLSASYRRRLEARGIDRQAWERGVDLRSARGHAPRRPNSAADFASTMRAITGRDDDTDQRMLRDYERASKPRWIPDGLSYDVVAALSQLRGTPADWAGVQLIPAPNGEPWTMIVRFH